jgi:major membrane immunogen (membrane-anchored lipoprotein)
MKKQTPFLIFLSAGLIVAACSKKDEGGSPTIAHNINQCPREIFEDNNKLKRDGDVLKTGDGFIVDGHEHTIKDGDKTLTYRAGCSNDGLSMVMSDGTTTKEVRIYRDGNGKLQVKEGL